jgi:hypothetical protein
MPGQRQTTGRISSLSSWNSTLKPNVKPRKPVENLHKPGDECKQSEQPRWAFHSPQRGCQPFISKQAFPLTLLKLMVCHRALRGARGPPLGGPKASGSANRARRLRTTKQRWHPVLLGRAIRSAATRVGTFCEKFWALPIPVAYLRMERVSLWWKRSHRKGVPCAAPPSKLNSRGVMPRREESALIRPNKDQPKFLKIDRRLDILAV